MRNYSAIADFAKTLAGTFDNINQAQENPKDFARIKIFFRPLPWRIFRGPGFYSEQCYDYAPWDPYRQGIHRLVLDQNLFVMENFAFDNPRRLAGAGCNPELLDDLHSESLKRRCGCAMHFRSISPGHYVGNVEPGKSCLIPRDGKLTYLVSEVEVNQTSWISRDRGFDPENNAQVWGSEHGMLRFKKITSFSNEITNELSLIHI